MTAGYVYIMVNPAMPGLVKIGCTLRDSRERARELYTTGVPAPFEVAFEVFAEEYESLEVDLHGKLAEFRLTPNREFFRFPLRETINLLLRHYTPPTELNSIYVAEGIFYRLKEKYADWLMPEITDIRIVQANDRVWLETTREEEIAGYLKDQTIKRTDLAFISDEQSDNGQFFSPREPVSYNARRFVEDFDPYSIVMTTDLFHEQACEEIDREYNRHRTGD